MPYLLFYVCRVTRLETLVDPGTLVGVVWEDVGGATERRATEGQEARRELECQRQRVREEESDRDSNSGGDHEHDNDIDRESEDQAWHRAIAESESAALERQGRLGQALHRAVTESDSESLERQGRLEGEGTDQVQLPWEVEVEWGGGTQMQVGCGPSCVHQSVGPG